MPHHDGDIVEHTVSVLRDALVLYYDFKALGKLTDAQRESFKELVASTVADNEKVV